MTQGKWSLIHRFLILLEVDCGMLAYMFDRGEDIRMLFLCLAFVFLVADTVAEPMVIGNLKREGRFNDFEDAPMAWDMKGIVTRLVGGLLVLMVMIAVFVRPESSIGGIQVLPMEMLTGPWFKGGAIIAFSVYFMYIAYESYCRNYASERRKKSIDGYKIRKWEE